MLGIHQHGKHSHASCLGLLAGICLGDDSHGPWRLQEAHWLELMTLCNKAAGEIGNLGRNRLQHWRSPGAAGQACATFVIWTVENLLFKTKSPLCRSVFLSIPISILIAT